MGAKCVGQGTENVGALTYGMTNPNGASVANFNRLNEWPLQFLRTSNYYRSYGYLYARTTNGYWWSSTASSATYGHLLYSWPSNVNAQRSYFRGLGFAVRCVAR